MTALSDRLREIVGAGNVLDDPASREEAVSDLFPAPDAVRADLVIRPADTEQTAAAARVLAEAQVAVVPRGAGLSYTGGVVPHVPSVVVDTGRMTGIRIDPDNLCATVGAGVSWQALADALAPHGLRVAQPTPISGAVTTVGGLAAQNLPGGMEGFLGATVVLADGGIVQTGALSIRDAPAFWRVVGPDLTGLFLGDCGAFGIKTELALRLAEQRASAFASFAFEDGVAMMNAMVGVMRRGLVARALAMDPVRGQSAAKLEAGEAFRTAAAVMAGAGGVRQALRDITQLARGGVQLAEPAWSLHLTADGVTEAGAEEAITAARTLAQRAGAREIAPAVPKALRARPYSIRGFVGPHGERWVPVHGILPLGAAQACLRALQARTEQLRPALERDRITVSHIISSLGAYVTIEPMFYWQDALDPLHMRHLSEKNRARFSAAPARPQARETVRHARHELATVMDAHGAVHAQVGRHYELLSRMTPGAAGLLTRIKDALDPAGRMNPGVLGLGKSCA